MLRSQWAIFWLHLRFFLGKIAATAEKSLRHNGFCTHFVAVIFAVADCERHRTHCVAAIFPRKIADATKKSPPVNEALIVMNISYLNFN